MPPASAAVLSTASPGPASGTSRVALAGNPNTGKTTIFNRLCGVRARTSNFPGTTTTLRSGRAEIAGDRYVEVIDLPGIYELHFESPEGRIARTVLAEGAPTGPVDAVVVLVDACNLPRNLVLVGDLLRRHPRVVVALNMVDLAARRGLSIGVDALARRLGVPVVAVVARTGQGLDLLRRAVAAAIDGPSQHRRTDLPARDASIETVSAWAEGVVSDVLDVSQLERSAIDPWTERVDRVLTHPVSGLLFFAVVMGGLFWTLFTLATVPMDLIELTFAQLGSAVAARVPEGPVRDLLTDGIIGGVAGTVVFLPQICLLFFLISLLEDTGYLARAAFVMDRVLRRFGLPGHAFVPLLTAHACALPGIMSARLIPHRRDRLATIMVAPFMSCSARLPVYVLLTSLLFANRPALAGLAFAGCYLLGAGAALLSAMVFGRTVFKGAARPMVLELPTYKRPSLANALLSAKDQALSFLRTAGTVIMAICVVMWWLSAYPRVPASAEAQALRLTAAEAGVTDARRDELLTEAAVVESRAAQAGSFAGRLGRALQPVFAPLGYDWQLTLGVVTSFLAREVFVSTMSVLVGGRGDADIDGGVIDSIRRMSRDDGRPVFTPATAASTLVFFVLAMQCLPTLAVTRRETGGLKYAALQLGYMSALAYAVALVTYQSLAAAGLGH
ncbi:MAG TPA: ferrous iron transporter B [Vicinamibacterales bacterium]|nr:ferrous iron transporter B [Vicinamibacterales bacterium]